jgi:NAD(P) transhydrogenase subunit alpha
MNWLRITFYSLILTMLVSFPAIAADETATQDVSLTPIFLAFILALSIFLGFELISKVPATLHTPLMSGSNAISGITLVGAIIAAGHSDDPLSIILGTAAVAFAMVNVVGGYIVTDRMLEMFKKKGE